MTQRHSVMLDRSTELRYVCGCRRATEGRERAREPHLGGAGNTTGQCVGVRGPGQGADRVEALGPEPRPGSVEW